MNRCEHGYAHRCGAFLPDPRGEATTDPKRRPGWHCQRCKHADPTHADFKSNGTTTSRTWTSADAEAIEEMHRWNQARDDRLGGAGAHPLSAVVDYEQKASQTGVAVSLGGQLLDRATREHPFPPAYDPLSLAVFCAAWPSVLAARRARLRELRDPYLTDEERRNLSPLPSVEGV